MIPARELCVTIAGATIAILSDDADLLLGVQGPSARFVPEHAAAAPDIVVRAQWGAPTLMAPGITPLFDSGGTWRLYRDGSALLFHLTSPKFGPLPYKTATFSEDFSTGVVTLPRTSVTPDIAVYPLEYPLDELVFMNWLSLGRGVELHACAVVDHDGRGYLFAGQSGHGKSTMARQWSEGPGVTVLSDDRIVLRKIDHQIWMYGTPWHGDELHAAPIRAPLTHGFFLEHGGRNRATVVTAPRVVAKLLARSFPPFFSAAGLDFILAFLADVAQTVPFSDLAFVPDRDAPNFVRQYAGGRAEGAEGLPTAR